MSVGCIVAAVGLAGVAYTHFAGPTAATAALRAEKAAAMVHPALPAPELPSPGAARVAPAPGEMAVRFPAGPVHTP